MDRNRRAVAGATAALAFGGAGCLGFVTGDEPLTFEATQTTVSEEVLGETGYEEVGVEDVVMTEEVASREIEVTNWQAQYERTIDLGIAELDAGVFVAFSTPKVEVAGRAFNPVDEMSNRELLSEVQSEYEDLEIGDRVGTDTVTMLGTDVEVDRFDGSATIAGFDLDIYLHVARVESGDDFVIALGVYPQQLSSEDDRIFRLIEGLER